MISSGATEQRWAGQALVLSNVAKRFLRVHVRVHGQVRLHVRMRSCVLSVRVSVSVYVWW